MTAHRRWSAAPLLVAALLLGSCSDDGGDDAAPTTTDTAPLVGDGRCDDPTGDVYRTTDPDAAPTGLAPGIDLTLATATVVDDELHLHYETVAPVQDATLPELVLFGGGPEDPARFEVRAVRGADGWALRVITFDASGAPQVAGVSATVEVHGTAVDFVLPVGLLPPLGDFVSFAYASTATDDEVPVNDECFPFAGRTPVGG